MPELSNQERNTQRMLMRWLRDLGIPAHTLPGSTGVVGTLAGRAPGGAVALRADMDALPVREETGATFRSRNHLMHACGHDVHMAALLGAAAFLKRDESHLPCPVKLLFQPAEEEGHRGGAGPMIEAGVLTSAPRVRRVFGLHLRSTLPLGTYAFLPGVAMAAADRVAVRVLGRGGHAAYPHLSVDPIVMASEMVLSLQTLISRSRDPLDPAVLSICRIDGGTKDNILPDEVRLEGTVRTVDPATRRRLRQLLRTRLRGIARASGGSVEIEYDFGYPVLRNDPGVTGALEDAFREEMGRSRVVRLTRPWMGAEDFARFLARVPGTFLFVGTGDGGTGSAPLHSARFLPSDRALLAAAAAHVLAVRTLGA